MKIVWTSDIHLNFLSEIEERNKFYSDILQRNPDCVVISGDIGEAPDVIQYVTEIETYISKPVYFVLGNHDFYESSIKATRQSVKHLGYLGSKQLIKLSEDTALIGVDGWGDCRNGDYENSRLTMSDWLYIKELKKAYLSGSQALKKELQRIADGDAAKLSRRVQKAVKNGFKRIIIVTHVPPYEEACLNSGRKSTPSGLPFFSSRILGDKIEPIAKQNPNIDFLWLCGHTHSKVDLNVLANLRILVAESAYYYPTVAGEIEYD